LNGAHHERVDFIVVGGVEQEANDQQNSKASVLVRFRVDNDQLFSAPPPAPLRGPAEWLPGKVLLLPPHPLPRPRVMAAASAADRRG
jgi:hypothetical protein